MENLNNYLNENIVPLVKIYKVADYKERYIKTVANLKTLRSENLKLLNEHRLIYNELEKKHASSNTAVFTQLKKHLTDVSKNTKELEFIEKAIGNMLNAFNEKTKGKIEVYSTEPFWEIIQQYYRDLQSKIKEIEKIQDDIKSEYSQFQKLAKTLNAE